MKYFGAFYLFFSLTLIFLFITFFYHPFPLLTIGLAIMTLFYYISGHEHGMKDEVINLEGTWVDFPDTPVLKTLFFIPKDLRGVEKEEELDSIDLLQNKTFLNLLKRIIDTNDMKFPLDESTIAVIYDELKQDGLEIDPTKLHKKIEIGFVKYVAQEYARVHLADIVWPEEYSISEDGLDGLYTLLEQKGINESKEDIRKQVNNEFLRQERERFKESYFRFKPELREVKEVEQLVEGFVDLFGEWYFPQLGYFEWFINEHTEKFFSQEDLKELIRNEIKKRTNLSRAEAIRIAIKTGRVNQDRVQIEDIDDMDGIEFEHYIQKLFSAMGYMVDVTKASGDQGADLIAEKFGSKIAIQTKRYRGSVGNKAIQEVIGAMQYYGCDKGIVVTNSTFTKSAIALAQKSNVELIDRFKLEELIEKYGTIVAS